MQRQLSILKTEKRQISKDILTQIALYSKGDVRQALKCLQVVMDCKVCNLCDLYGDINEKDQVFLFEELCEENVIETAESFYKRSLDFKLLLHRVQKYVLENKCNKTQESLCDMLEKLAEIEMNLQTRKEVRQLFPRLLFLLCDFQKI